MTLTHAVTLPHGVFGGTERRQEVVLRPPDGADEAYLLEDVAELSQAERVTGLLARCIVRIGGDEPREEAVRSLTVGDREALLLHLRAAALGDRLACILDCPECGERMDLDLDVSQVLLPPYPDACASYEASVGAGRARYDVRFRLPTGADQEVAAHESDLDAAARSFLERCVEDVRARGRRLRAVPETVEAELPPLLAELDPQAEAVVRLSCPDCGAEVAALLDAATILFRELAGSKDSLYREVHTIALHYHWSEQEILGLDVRRRRRYLELIAELQGGGE